MAERLPHFGSGELVALHLELQEQFLDAARLDADPRRPSDLTFVLQQLQCAAACLGNAAGVLEDARG